MRKPDFISDIQAFAHRVLEIPSLFPKDNLYHIKQKKMSGIEDLASIPVYTTE